LHLARKRQGEDDGADFAQRATKLDSTNWPGLGVKFYLGQVTAEQLLAAAADPDAKKDKEQRCDANFLLAEDALLDQDRVHAIARFKASRDNCPRSRGEYEGAAAELRQLEKSAPPARKAQSRPSTQKKQ